MVKYTKLSKVSFSNLKVKGVKKEGTSANVDWKIYSVVGPTDFVLTNFETLGIEVLSKRSKAFTSAFLKVNFPDFKILDEEMKRLWRTKVTITKDDPLCQGDLRVVDDDCALSVDIPMSGERMRAAISLDGERVPRTDFDKVDQEMGGKMVVRITGILVTTKGGPRLQVNLLVANFESLELDDQVETIDVSEDED